MQRNKSQTHITLNRVSQTMRAPKIACIGVIGKADNPLHMSLFPPYSSSAIEFSFLLNSSLDIFEMRQKQTSIDQDLGLLHAVDERLASYGWLTTTGVKFLIIVDLIGEQALPGINEARGNAPSSFRESDLKPAFRALQTAYIQLLQNPFYSPGDHVTMTNGTVQTAKPSHITDQKFIAEVNKIGNSWTAGTTNL
ncbi:Sedlin [Aspergillus aurantiobrunneus]